MIKNIRYPLNVFNHSHAFMMGIIVYKIDFTQQVAFVFFISVILFLKNIVLNKNVYMEKITFATRNKTTN